MALLFADDTALYAEADNIDSLINLVNTKFKKFVITSEWTNFPFTLQKLNILFFPILKQCKREIFL